MPRRRPAAASNTNGGEVNGTPRYPNSNRSRSRSRTLASIAATLPGLSLSAGSTPPEEELVDPVGTPQSRANGPKDFFRGYGQAVFNNVTGEVAPMSIKLFEIGDGAWARINALVSILNGPSMTEETCRQLVQPPSQWSELYKRFQKVIHIMVDCLPEIPQPAMDGFTVAYLLPDDDFRCPLMPGWRTVDRMAPAERASFLLGAGIFPHPGKPRIRINIWQSKNFPCQACWEAGEDCYFGVQNLRMMDPMSAMAMAMAWNRTPCLLCNETEQRCSYRGEWAVSADGWDFTHLGKFVDPRIPTERLDMEMDHTLETPNGTQTREHFSNDMG